MVIVYRVIAEIMQAIYLCVVYMKSRIQGKYFVFILKFLLNTCVLFINPRRNAGVIKWMPPFWSIFMKLCSNVNVIDSVQKES